MYDTRAKAARDHQWLINGARLEGREEGRQEGRVEGIQEGLELGQVIGIVRYCPAMLGLPESSPAELVNHPIEELNKLAQLLQQKVRCKVRPASQAPGGL